MNIAVILVFFFFGEALAKSVSSSKAAIVDDLGRVVCGATLITDQHVLTAAHCVQSSLWFDYPRIYLRLQDVNILEDGVVREVLRIIRHPNFNSITNENDIAIIEMDERVSFTQDLHPACLPCEDTDLSGEKVTVSGWGTTEEDWEGGTCPLKGGEPSNLLQEVTLPVVDYDICAEAYSILGPHDVQPTMLCAGYLEGGKDSCQGDSGGPLIWHSDDGVAHLVGIVSWGLGCAEPSAYGVNTKVSSFLDWIDNNTRTKNC